MEKLVCIKNDKLWIEDDAISQVKSFLNLKGIEKIVTLPDLHPGKIPVGVVVLSNDIIYPHIIGSDIGCGMSLFKTDIKKNKFKKDRFVLKLSELKQLSDIDGINIYNEESPINDLGTIGNGNHFLEFQCVEKIYNKEEFNKLNISNQEVCVVVHSGSRAYGQAIINKFPGTKGINSKSDEAKEYIQEHNNAILWAERNRQIVANKIISYLGFKNEPKKVIECIHNFIEVSNRGYIHRKGALSSENQVVIIPGSRGDLTYIVKPIGNKEKSLYSLAHGAGRKWPRTLCKYRIKEKRKRDEMKKTRLKSDVICQDDRLLYEEAPEVYKNIEQVINCLLEYGLIEIIATMKPLITYKG